MNYSSNDVFYQLHLFADSISQAIHPGQISYNLLVDPHRSDAVTFTASQSSHSGEEWAYTMQLQVIQGVCFGIAFLALLSASIFLMVRVLYNGFGGHEPSKFGYSSASVWSIKIFYYVFAVLLLVSVSFGFVGTSKMANGIHRVTSIFYSSLPEMTPQQMDHLRQVLRENSEWMSEMGNNGTSAWLNDWQNAVSPSLTSGVNASVFGTLPDEISTKLLNISELVTSMRDHRVKAYTILDGMAKEIRDQVTGTPIESDVQSILDQMQGYYNFTIIDSIMREVNSTLEQVSPDSANAVQHTAGIISTQLKPETVPEMIKEEFNSFGDQMNFLFQSLNYGPYRCQMAVEGGHAVSPGAEGMVKFTKLVQMLNPLNSIAAPILYVLGGLLILAAISGGAAIPFKIPAVMYPSATVFVLSIVILWTVTGFILPAAIVTSDTCKAGNNFFQSSNLTAAVTQNMNNNQSQSIATCAACEKENIMVSWPEFSERASQLAQSDYSVFQAFSAPMANDRFTGSYPALQAWKNTSTLLQPLPRLTRSKVAGSWWNDQEQLAKNETVTGNPEYAKIVEALDAMGKDLIYTVVSLHNEYVQFKNNVTELVPSIDRAISSMTTIQDEHVKVLTASFTELQGKVNDKASQFKPVSYDGDAVCVSNSSQSFDDSTYNSFEQALCGDALVGLDTTWLFSIITAILAAPLVILAVKAYKHLAFASYFSNEYRSF